MRISSSRTFLEVCLWCCLLDMAAGKNGKAVEVEAASWILEGACCKRGRVFFTDAGRVCAVET